MSFDMHHILSAEEGEKLVRDAEKKLSKQMGKVQVALFLVSLSIFSRKSKTLCKKWKKFPNLITGANNANLFDDSLKGFEKDVN
jgi:hypothetical protein